MGTYLDELAEEQREKLDTYVPPDVNKAKGTMAPKKRRAPKRTADLVDDGLNVDGDEQFDIGSTKENGNRVDMNTNMNGHMGSSSGSGMIPDQKHGSTLGNVVGLGPKRGSVGPIGLELPQARQPANGSKGSNKRQKKNKQEEPRLIMGFDFGTT